MRSFKRRRAHPRGRRIGRATLRGAGALGIALLAGALAACGASSTTHHAATGASGSLVVAQVGAHAITKHELDRWTAIEAVLAYQTNPTSPVPKGVVPDPPGYAQCSAYLAATAPAEGQAKLTASELKRQCGEKQSLLQNHILDILITSYWLKDEAREQHVTLTSREVEAVLDHTFPSTEALHRYLAITGERPSDERLIIEKDLLDSKLLQLEERATNAKGPPSEPRHRQWLLRAATEFTDKWSARTTCRAGYVVSECRQYTAKRSLVLP
jgi:hypothetical protein